MQIPAALEARRRLGDRYADWLDRLPRLADEIMADWRLDPTGPPTSRSDALLVPVGDQTLTIGFDGDPDTAQEHLALQTWNGDGAPLMHRADPRRRALVVESVGEDDLTAAWDVQACEQIADLYRLLHRPAPNRMTRLTTWLAPRLDALAAADLPLPPRLVEQALGCGRDLMTDDASDGTLIHGDLHYATVRSAEPIEWAAVDPRPLSGDPHFEPAPLLWHRWDEMDGYLRESIRTRFFSVVEAAGLDDRRARDWVIVRAVLRAHAHAADRTEVTRCISVAKAVQG